MKKRWIKGLVVCVLIVAITVATLQRDQLDPAQLEAWLRSFGWWAPALFFILYTAGTVLFLPGSLLTILGGALFGPLWGTVINLTAATLGAAIAFLIARYLAHDWVMQRAGGMVKKLLDGVEAEGWRFVAFVRLVPLFPFNLLNYALGLTRISLTTSTVTSWICMLPGSFVYTYIGYVGKEALAGGEGVAQKALLALAALAFVMFIPRLVKQLRGQVSMEK
uniref:TVP38/TMEM64 family membrane protein n=1 Tax=Magnetococcus massalia (strain MO-1) TaxID=451514 RepID=A0A1S7LE28_MAGMO|nr:conserved membrane protein of unknown function [Candidatus Magnetococcus massalia]